eukprot:s1259_g15.t1
MTGDMADDLYKTRRCKAIVAEAPCSLGEVCTFAHSAAELRPYPWPEPLAEHWRGQVSIGVVEHAMFWDLPPVGTLDVVCNRATCLGNPFGSCSYADPTQRPPVDAAGWCAGEHEVLVTAYDEYLQAVLSQDATTDLQEEVQRIAERRSLLLSDAWEKQDLKREDVRSALDALASQVSRGCFLRLLCHCRPYVRCHAESIKRYLDQFTKLDAGVPTPLPNQGPVDIEGRVWPSSAASERCSIRTKRLTCTRAGRALDPGSMKSYCAQCWSYHSVVYFWPDWDDVWPECFYRDGYVQCTAGVDDADREGDCAYVDRPLCSFYVRGCCKFGDDCWYRHAKRIELLGSHAQGKLSRLGSLESVHLHLCLQVATPGDPGAGGLGFDGNLLRACCCKLPDFCVQIACTLLK